MGRKIKASAGNSLSVREAVALNHAYATILKAALEQRLGQIGGTVAMLGSVVEIAADAGYQGTIDQAGDILRREGGFIVEPDPSGRLTVRRADSR